MKQQLLYVTPFFEIPPTSGASLRSVNLLESLATEYQVTLLTYQPDAPLELEQWCQSHHIYSYYLTTKARYGRNHGFFKRLFSERPPGFATHCVHGIIDDMDHLWASFGPYDIVYFATQLTAQVLLYCRFPALNVVDLYDIYSPVARNKCNAVSPMRPYHWLFWAEAVRIQRYERRILSAADLLLTVSDVDCTIVDEMIADTSIHVIPNGVHVPSNIGADCDGHQVLTVGSYHYLPNREGAEWFYVNIWPRVKRVLPEACWMIVGRSADLMARLTAGDDSVRIAADVSDLSDYYAGSSCAAIPILTGGGTRLKVLEAMAWGIPIVTTSKGVEGIEHGGTVNIADTPEEFSEALIECLVNPEPARQQAQLARVRVIEQYSWDVIGHKLRETLRQYVHTP